MGDDEAAFLATIVAYPQDGSPRFIFADWLDEQGRELEAETQRVLGKYPEPSTTWNRMVTVSSQSPGEQILVFCDELSSLMTHMANKGMNNYWGTRKHEKKRLVSVTMGISLWSDHNVADVVKNDVIKHLMPFIHTNPNCRKYQRRSLDTLMATRDLTLITGRTTSAEFATSLMWTQAITERATHKAAKRIIARNERHKNLVRKLESAEITTNGDDEHGS